MMQSVWLLLKSNLNSLGFNKTEIKYERPLSCEPGNSNKCPEFCCQDQNVLLLESADVLLLLKYDFKIKYNYKLNIIAYLQVLKMFKHTQLTETLFSSCFSKPWAFVHSE